MLVNLTHIPIDKAATISGHLTSRGQLPGAAPCTVRRNTSPPGPRVWIANCLLLS
jgi:hypothetical protein